MKTKLTYLSAQTEYSIDLNDGIYEVIISCPKCGKGHYFEIAVMEKAPSEVIEKSCKRCFQLMAFGYDGVKEGEADGN